MEYIIHLTDNCNLNCKYCYEKKRNKDIDFSNITKVIDREIENKSKSSIIYFYGGEPLLKKDIIKSTIEYAKNKKSKTKFYYGITTNGTLLDDEFLDYMSNNNFISVAYSIDGNRITQDLNRLTISENSTFDIVEENAKKVLSKFKYVTAMVAVTKNNIKYLGNNVQYLIDLGFNKINLQFNHLDDWNDDDLNLISNGYIDATRAYGESLLNNKKVSIPSLDRKVYTYLDKKATCNEECEIGTKHINVGTDGNYYPCMQFVYNKDFIIGNCTSGIDIISVKKISSSSKKEYSTCEECDLRTRCKHTCSCINYSLTGDVGKVPPIICESEKRIIEAVDQMTDYIYSKSKKIFAKKYILKL